MAKDYIDRHYTEEIDLTEVAAEAGYSRYHFLRGFSAAYGETPGRYLSRRRIERARELLGAANLTVTEVCHLVGFSSVGTFSARFKAVVGISPSQYRRRSGRPAPVPGCYVLMWANGFATGPGTATQEKPAPRPRR
ncbi:AraC-like DNA-binding protein [Allonocardiopsis opalescens]|uniref:AraC-like DNA-binding protein n=2 Tax=Allonocardiopsis opalescens TaxID=1144618 RepID=A0A2T0Q7Q5_9ACTN|nr:AraC-like DNA-binding protein [Allonocardiopsis opalescens]